MKYHIHKAVVIGSGTMGAAIAAHLANAGVPVTLLDIVPKDAPINDKAAPNKIVNEGWERCLKARPANLMAPELKTLVRLGNLEDDFGAVAEAEDPGTSERSRPCAAVVEDVTMQLKPRRRLLRMLRANAPSQWQIRWGARDYIVLSTRPASQILAMQRHARGQSVIEHGTVRESVADRLHLDHRQVRFGGELPEGE